MFYSQMESTIPPLLLSMLKSSPDAHHDSLELLQQVATYTHTDAPSNAPIILLSMAATLSSDGDHGDTLLDRMCMALLSSKQPVPYGCYMPTDDMYTSWAQMPNLFKAFTNFFPVVFDELFSRVQGLAAMPVDVRGNRRAPHLQGQPRQVGPSGAPVGRPSKLSLQTRFMIFLAALRGGLGILDRIGACGLNQAGLSDDFYHFLPCVLEALADEISWPDEAERRQLEGSLWDFPSSGLIVPILVLDGTLQEVQRPRSKDTEAMFYLGRKTGHFFNHQVICQWNGKIRAAYVGFYGSKHDSACYKDTPVYVARDEHFSSRQTMLADSGYYGCHVLPIRKAPLSAEEMQLNARMRRHRVIIEFVFGALKNKFHILRKVWPSGANLEMAPFVFFVCCQLLNFWMSKYGYLRGAAYKVRHELEVWEQRLLQNQQLGGMAWNADEAVFQMILDGRANDLYDLIANAGVL